MPFAIVRRTVTCVVGFGPFYRFFFEISSFFERSDCAQSTGASLFAAMSVQPTYDYMDLVDLINAKKYNKIMELLSDESLLKYVVSTDDSHIVRELARDGTRCAFDIAKVLIANGASKLHLIKSSAFHGNVSFLERICEQGWHDFEGSWDTIVASAAEASQLEVLRWIDLPLGYLTKDNIDDYIETLDNVISWSITNDDVAIFEFAWSKLVDKYDPMWKKLICYEAVTEWAPHILEHMFEKLGREDVLSEVEECMYLEVFEFKEDARKWMKKQRDSFDVSSSIKEVMSLIDEIRDHIPEGHYLKISDQLLKVYRR